MENLKKKPFEVTTLTEYGTLTELTQNRPDKIKTTGTAMRGVMTSTTSLTHFQQARNPRANPRPIQSTAMLLTP
jgi:hypothetical protein